MIIFLFIRSFPWWKEPKIKNKETSAVHKTMESKTGAEFFMNSDFRYSPCFWFQYVTRARSFFGSRIDNRACSTRKACNGILNWRRGAGQNRGLCAGFEGGSFILPSLFLVHFLGRLPKNEQLNQQNVLNVNFLKNFHCIV